MKISVSNIAWQKNRLEEHLDLLKHIGCDGVELAPSCIWPEPINASLAERQALEKKINRSGLKLVGFHALLYNHPELCLFSDRSSYISTIKYLKSLAHLCSDLNGRILVFGSPRNRHLFGRDFNKCFNWACDAFREVATECALLGVTFCIEPLGPNESDFIISSKEGAKMVKSVSHPNFLLHLDTKALMSTGEDIEEVMWCYGKYLKHFHVSDPELAPPGTTGIDHTQFGVALRKYNYQGFVSIEMRLGQRDSREVITESVNLVKRQYLNL